MVFFFCINTELKKIIKQNEIQYESCRIAVTRRKKFEIQCVSSLYGPYGGEMQSSDRETRGRCLMPPAVEMQKQSQIQIQKKMDRVQKVSDQNG